MEEPIVRPAALLALAGLVLTACGGVDSDAGSVPREGDAAVTGEVAAPDGVCGAGESLYAGEDPIPSSPVDDEAIFPWISGDAPVLDGFDADEIISGGPPPDGIKPIDLPCFESIASASDWLAPQSPVLVVDVEGEGRAYPLGILTRHEIANDVIAGMPLTVTYCPLCNSGIAFDRRVDGVVLDFGTSGRLYRSNLVMYDRQTKNLWSQFTGQAVVGDPYVGTQLVRLPVSTTSFEEFAAAHPDGAVLARPIDRDRGYGINPYENYDEIGVNYLFRGPTDERIDPNSRLIGVSTDDGSEAIGITLDVLREERAIELEFQGEPLTVWWAPGAASALDTAVIEDGRDVGQTGAFRPVASDGSALTFVAADDEAATFTDEQTGSTWNILGHAISGPLEGERLTPVTHDDTFWFVWFAFRPATSLVS